jgi:hypothetical protein
MGRLGSARVYRSAYDAGQHDVLTLLACDGSCDEDDHVGAALHDEYVQQRYQLWCHCALPKPGFLFEDAHGGWSVDVAQVDWGHVAIKRTWLYLVGVPRSELVFPGHGKPTHVVESTRRAEGIKLCSAQQRRRTPPAFARWLVDLAHTALVREVRDPATDGAAMR